jgi:hypothetical protein
MTIGAATPMPASRARIPNEAPNTSTGSASGAIARAPAATLLRVCGRAARSAIMEPASMLMEVFH